MIIGLVLPDASHRPRNGWPEWSATRFAAALVGGTFMTSD